jgi:hypothetical protein
MRYADISLPTQVILVVLLVAAAAAVLTRSLIFLRRELSGMRPLYPDSWSALQRRTLESFRLLVGLAVISFWGFFLFIAPSLPTNAPFGYLEAVFLIMLLLISHAWVLFLTPRNSPKRAAFSSSFWVTMTVLAVGWLSTFAVTGWILVRASAPPPPRFIPLDGVYAFLHPSLLGAGLGSLSATAVPESSSMRTQRRPADAGDRPALAKP